jgi:hypothetical protein
MGIEPTLSAWKAEILPLNYTRSTYILHQLHKAAIASALYTTLGGGGRIRTFEGRAVRFTV